MKDVAAVLGTVRDGDVAQWCLGLVGVAPKREARRLGLSPGGGLLGQREDADFVEDPHLIEGQRWPYGPLVICAVCAVVWGTLVWLAV